MSSPASPPPAREPRRIKSIEVGFRILRVLEQSESKLSLKEIAQRTGMPASNAYLYLMSFVHEGMAEQDPKTSHYGLGALAVQLGSAALRQSNLIERAKSLLMQLRDDTDNSVFLAVWGNRGPTVVFKIDGNQYGPLGIRVGHVLPLLSTATGRVFLSHLAQAHTAPMVERERQASVSLAGGFDERIREAVAPSISLQVQQDGYAHTDSSMSGGFAASSAPVFDHEGQICAAITILGPESSFSDAERRVNQRLTATAQELSRRLGAS